MSNTNELDWDDLRYFLAAAGAASLAGASRRLGVSVATVGRRLDRLEEALELRLFHRHSSGLTLTPRAAELLARAERVGERVADLTRVAAGSVDDDAGTVTITTLETLATHVLVPHVVELRRLHPRIDVVIRSEQRLLRLVNREADLAIRVVKPREERVVTRRIATLQYGVFASHDYLERRGRPDDPLRSLGSHDAVTYEPRFEGIPEIDWLQQHRDGPRLVLRVTTAAAIQAAVESGVGLGILPAFLDSPSLVRLVGPEHLPHRQIWLAMHEDLRHTPRVRVVADYVADLVRKVVGEPLVW